MEIQNIELAPKLVGKYFVVLKPDLAPLVRIEVAFVSYFVNFNAGK